MLSVLEEINTVEVVTISMINLLNCVFYTFSIRRNKCSRSCNNINDKFARLCVSDVNQTRHTLMA